MNRYQVQLRQTYPVTGEPFSCRLDEQGDVFTFEVAGALPEGLTDSIALTIESGQAGEGLCRTESGQRYAFAWTWVGAELHLWLAGDLFVFQQAETRGRDRAAPTGASGDVGAPMPGAVLEVLVSEGDRVERHQPLLILESMKMELVISAPYDGFVRRVAVQPGQQVDRGMRLLELAVEGEPG